MLRIGYLRRRPVEFGGDPTAETARLSALGCEVVRTEMAAPSGGQDDAVLGAILDQIAAGDELVVTRLDQLGDSGRAMLEVLERLERRGAGLRVQEVFGDAAGVRAWLRETAAIGDWGATR